MISKETLGLWLLTAIGAVLRLITLTKESFWFDEGATAVFSTQTFSQIANFAGQTEYNPPLFYWIEHIVVSLVGLSTFTLRLVPAIAGILTIPAIFYLGKEIRDKWLGFAAVILLVFSPWHIAFSQEARGYTLVVLFFTCALIYLIRLLRRRDLCVGQTACGYPITTYRDTNALPSGGYFYASTTWAFGFGIFGALCIWTHFFSAVFVLPLVLIVAIKRWGSWPSFFAALLPVFSLLPLVPSIYQLSSTYVEGAVAMKMAGLYDVLGLGLISTTLYDLSGFSVILSSFVLASIPVGLYLIYRRDKTVALISATLIIFPFIVGILESSKILLTPRYFSCMFPILLILLGEFILSFKQVSKQKLLSIAVLALILFMYIPSLFILYEIPQKPEWRETATYIEGQDVDNIVIITGMYAWHPLRIYYSGNATFQSVQNIQQLENVTVKGKTAYVVSVGEMEWIDVNDSMTKYLENITTPEEYSGVRVYITQ